MLSSGAGGGYGTLPRAVPPASGRRGRVGRVAGAVAVVFVALAAVVAILAVTLPVAHRTSLVETDGDLDAQYLGAEAKGEQGREFLQRLQRMWFVMHHKGHEGLAKQASELAAEMQIASFPHDVKSAINTEVNPCDDFYEFACGKWDKANLHSIPKFQTSWALSWDAAEEKVVDKMISVLEKDDGPSGTYFKACADVDEIEKEGGKPMEPWFKLIDGIHDHQSLVDGVVELNKGGIDHLFSWYIDTDTLDNKKHAFFLAESGGSLPDQSYYTDQTPEMEAHRAKFVERMTHFFTLIGREKAAEEANLVMSYETALAGIMQDHTEAYKSHAQKSSWEEMDKMVPSWPWKSWLNKLAACTEPFNGLPKLCTHDHEDVKLVGQPGGRPLYINNKVYFEKLDKFINDQPLDAIKAKMRWNIVKDSAASLSNVYQDALLDWYKDLYGVQQKSARPRKCYYSTTSSVGWASARLYSDKIFNHDNVAAATKMLGEIREQFGKSIPHADWMSESSRKAAKGKLDAMFFEVGIPTDKEGKVDWPARAEVLKGKLGGNFYRNGEISTRVGMERSFNKLSQGVTRRSWGGSTPLEVNAFYGPESNGLWIPAGILQEPFFDAAHTDAENYGSVGTILGHEMSHAFDDDGSQYDAEGQLRDWWDAQTVKGFKERSTCISGVFDKYKVLDKPVNGKLTLGEDIADAGGLKFSFRALTATPRTEAEKRLFFTAFAQTWCEVDRKKSAVNSVLTDEHAPGKFRVLGALTQFKPFAETFKCPQGSPMAPKDGSRCHLW